MLQAKINENATDATHIGRIELKKEELWCTPNLIIVI